MKAPLKFLFFIASVFILLATINGDSVYAAENPGYGYFNENSYGLNSPEPVQVGISNTSTINVNNSYYWNGLAGSNNVFVYNHTQVVYDDHRYVERIGDNMSGDLLYTAGAQSEYYTSTGALSLLIGAVQGSFPIGYLQGNGVLAIRPLGLGIFHTIINDLQVNADFIVYANQTTESIRVNGTTGRTSFNKAYGNATVDVNGTGNFDGDLTAPNLCYTSGNCGSGTNLTNVAYLNETQNFTGVNRFNNTIMSNITVVGFDGATRDYIRAQNQSGFGFFRVYEQFGLKRMALCNIGRCYTFDPGNGAIDSSGVSMQINPTSGLGVGIGSTNFAPLWVGNRMGSANVNGFGLINAAPQSNTTTLYAGVVTGNGTNDLMQFRNDSSSGLNLTTIRRDGSYITANITPRLNNTFSLGSGAFIWQSASISNISTRRVEFGNGLYVMDNGTEITTIYNRTGSIVVTINQTNSATRTVNIPHLIQASPAYVCVATDGWLYSSTTGCAIGP